MAQLRLIAVCVVGIACRASEAGPTSGLATPAGWHALPAIATAASDVATQAKLVVDGIEAWGEPARGCYAAWLALTSDRGAPEILAEKMVQSVAAESTLAGITITDVVKPTAGADAGVLSFAFTRPPYRGRMRAQIARTGSYAVLACFWNQREPIACEAACTQLIGSMK